VAKAIFGPPNPKVEVRPHTAAAAIQPIQGIWNVEQIHEDFTLTDITAFGSPVAQTLPTRRDVMMTLRLHEPDNSPPAQERRRVEYALRDQPEQIQRTIEALFQLEEGLPRDREAIVEVETTDTGPKFTVTTRTNPNPEPPPADRDWYKRWKVRKAQARRR
jgi:hypothetical protein